MLPMSAHDDSPVTAAGFVDATMTTLTARRPGEISHILHVSALPEILATIVQPITTAVVNQFKSAGASHNLSMHVQMIAAASRPCRIGLPTTPQSPPSVLHQFDVVLGVNNCMRNDFTLAVV